jgi:hypothetical protein
MTTHKLPAGLGVSGAHYQSAGRAPSPISSHHAFGIQSEHAAGGPISGPAASEPARATRFPLPARSLSEVTR